MGLKTKLEELIKEKGYITYSDIESYSRIFSYKLSNLERRLREMPNVEPVFNEKTLFNNKHYIIGYRYAEKVVL